MKIKNLLHQPIELNFDKENVYRFEPRDVRQIPDIFADSPVLEAYKNDIRIIEEPKVVAEKARDEKPKK